MRCLRRQIWCLIIIPVLAIGLFFGCNKPKKVYKVLVIQSYDSGYAKAPLLEEGIREGFNKQGIEIQLDLFYLDCEIKTASEETEFMIELMDSYQDKKLDLIIACDDQATFSLLSVKHPKTYKTPIVFCGVDYFNYDLIKERNNVTGLMLKHDFNLCLDLAEKLFNVRKVYFLTDSTFLGLQFRNDFEDQLKYFEKPPLVDFFNATELRSKFIIWQFNTADPNSIIIIPRYDNIYPLYTLKSSAPIFVMSNEAFNENVFYGNMVDDKQQTLDASTLGAKILNGENPMEIPIAFHQQKMFFNWKSLKKWNVEESALPSGSIVVNIPFTEQYKYYMIFAGVITLFLLVYFIGSYIKEYSLKRKFQQKLIKQRNEFDITLRALNDGVISVDCNGNIFSINNKAIEYLHLELPPESYIDKGIYSILKLTNTKNQSLSLASLVESALGNNTITKFPDNTFLSASDGSSAFPISGEMARIIKDDELYGIVVVFRDISNEYTQKEFLNLTFNESKVYPWLYDVEKKTISYGNNLFVSENGLFFTIEQLERFMHPDEKDAWKKLLDSVHDGKVTKGVSQFRMKYNDKGYEWFEYRYSSMPNASNAAPSKVFGICANIEYIKKRESELTMARDMAAKAELKQSFLANMSHEIRTPLNAIVGFSNLLTDQDDLDENDKKEFVMAINRNSEQLLTLIGDVLELSRIDSGNMSFSLERCDVCLLIDGIYMNMRVTAPKEIELVKKTLSEPVYLNIDPLRMTQVLSNFLNNAFKFTKEGSVTIGCEVVQENYVDLYVQDTGQGISEEEQIMIFERFYKIDEFAQGTGLGLSICKTIVTRLGGEIILESKLREGSRFIVRMPYLK